MKTKRLVGLILAVVMVFTSLFAVHPTFQTTVEAGIGGKIAGAIVKKGLEVGVRYAVKASVEAAARSGTTTALPVVESIINHALLDAQGVAINEINAMCKEILQQLTKIETELKEYTAEISSAIAKQNKNEIHQQFEEKWKSDVTDVLAKERVYDSQTGVGVNEALDSYIKYLIVSNLYANDIPVGSVSDVIKEYWYTNYNKPFSASDYTLTAVNEAKQNLELQFMRIFNKNSDLTARERVYKDAGVFHKLNDALNELTNNFVYTGSGQKGYSVVDCAATDAFFGLPENSDQYVYVLYAAKKQIFYATLLQMCMNEYLSMQGEYLQKNTSDPDWATDVNLISNADSTIRSYNSYVQMYSETIETSLERSVALMDAEIKINTALYSGNTTDVKVKLKDYMHPEDATNVYLDIEGGPKSVNYRIEVSKMTNDNHSYDKTVSDPDLITNNLSFRRLRMGLGDTVYLIYNSSNTPLKSLTHRIKRYGTLGVDGMVGDLVVSSADYVNLRKTFTDGTNKFSIPDNFETGYKDLFDTPDYTAVHEKNPGAYLSPYLPLNTTGTTYLLSKDYSNNFYAGPSIAPRTGWVNLGKLFGSVNESQVPLEKKDFEDIESNSSDKYAVIAIPTDTYKQQVTLKTVDTENVITDAYILSDAGEKKYNGETTSFEPANDVTIRFKFKEGGTVKHLKMKRFNVQQTETVFFESDEFSDAFIADEDGYYSFTIPMPYSKIEIELEGTYGKLTETDDEGHYVISTYEDLKVFAANVYNYNEEYADKHYVLANNIDCSASDQDPWDYPIGRNENKPFRGTFDGNGYTISNLYFVNPAEDLTYQGLFGVLDGATVKNLNLTNVSSYANSSNLRFGYISGKMLNQSLISNCYVHANVGAMDVRLAYAVGGICGVMENSTIEKTINEANIACTLADYAGGIVGSMKGGTVSYCGNREWVSATIRNNNKYIGGITGHVSNSDPATISNSYTAGLISVGNDYKTNVLCGGDIQPTLSNNYSPDKTFSSDQWIQIENYDMAEDFRSGEVAYILNNDNPAGVWRQTIGVDKFPGFDGKAVTKVNGSMSNVYVVSFDANGGSGTMETAYTVGTYTLPSSAFVPPEGKAFGAWIVNGEERKAGDTVTFNDDITISALWITKCTSHTDTNLCNGFCDVCGEPLVPEVTDGCYKIGTYGELVWFAENVSGAHKVKLTADITINPALAEWNGISLADNSPSTFDGAGHTITFKNTSMGLFTNYNYSVIENINFDGDIIAPGNADNRAGVVVNSAYCTTIRNVTVRTNITQTASGAYTGGIAGYFGGENDSDKYSLIENCAVYGNINGSGDTGGFVGRIWDGTQYCEIRNCLFAGSISGASGSTGAIVGYNGTDNGYDSPLTKCYYLCDDSSIGAVGGSNGGTNTLNDTSAKTTEEIKNGSVAYALGSSWGQRIYVDNYPVLKGVKVYKYIGEYSNKHTFGFAETSANTAVVNIPESGTYTVIFADYDGNRLANIDYVVVEAENPGEKTAISDISLGSGDKIMLWNRLETVEPLCDAYLVK